MQARYANDTRGHTADPVIWEQAFYVCDFDRARLREIRIYPIELGFGEARSQRGRPMLASPEAAQRIVSRLAELSAAKGTEMEFADGIGIIRR